MEAANNADLAASKAQWASLMARIKALEALGIKTTVPEKQELRKKRATLRALESKQHRGDWSTIQTTE